MPLSRTWAKPAAVALALALAAPICAQRMTTMLPGTVKNFELPNFNENTGDKEWELFGEKAAYKSDTRIDVESFRLLLFEDGANGALKATITSPSARVDPVKKFVSGDSDIFVRAPEFKIDGKKWTWDSAKKFVEVFDGITVDIFPAGGEKKGAPDTRITGRYGSMLGEGGSNVFDVRKNVKLENSQMKLECDALRAVAPKERRGGSGVSEIDAEGNIKMLYENKDIRAGGAKILPSESAALLSGSPHIKDIPSRAEISGDTIEIDRGKKSLAAKSGKSGRARAVIFNTDSDGKEERIAISADSIKMRTEGEKNFFDFSGNVKVDADSFRASCDSLSAQSASKEGGKPEVSRIEGGGNVRLSNENGNAAADRMEILPGRGEVVLSDNASLADPERGMKLFADVIVFLKEKSTGLAFANPKAENSDVVLNIREGISAGEKPKKGAETVVKSKRLKFVKNEKNMRFDFDRDVRITSDDIRASCEKMQVLAIRDGKGGDSVRKITATDSVKISQKGYSAEAETAVIYPKLKGGDGGKSAPHRYVELLISPANPGKRPTIRLPATKAIGLEEVRADKKLEEKPTVITSDRQWLVGGTDSDRYFFEGDVKAAGTDMDVSCEKAEVEMRKLKNGGHSISKIYLLESVNLSSGLKSATCGRAEVFPEDEMVVLSEDPVVIDREDNTRVSGPRMVYNRGRRSMTVEAENPQSAPAAQSAPRSFIPDFEDDETLSPARNRPPRPTVKMLPRSRK